MTKLTIFLILTIFCQVVHSQVIMDKHYKKQWYLKYQAKELGLNIEKSWNITRGKSSVVIAVIDTGIDYDHVDIKNNMWKNTKEIPGNNKDDDKNGYVDDVQGWNFVSNNNLPFDDHGHGTHVAGIIGASHNSTGIAGIMARVKIMPVKTCDQEGFCDITVESIKYAVDNGANIINISIAGGVYSKKISDAFKYARNKNVVVVIAAGNSSSNRPTYPGSYDVENIISVASTDQQNIKSDFSNYSSKYVHVFAPGSNIFSLLPRNNYGPLSGTSMAAPIVSGIAGLILSYHGKGAAKSMRERLMYTSTKFRLLSGQVSANGIVNPYSALMGQQSIEFYQSE